MQSFVQYSETRIGTDKDWVNGGYYYSYHMCNFLGNMIFMLLDLTLPKKVFFP